MHALPALHRAADTYYNALCDMHGVERHNATISVHYHGTGVKRPPWSNQNGGAGEIFTSVAGAHRAARLSKDIERWNEAVVREKVSGCPHPEHRTTDRSTSSPLLLTHPCPSTLAGFGRDADAPRLVAMV